jgi:predicted small lipoprotein YifL
VIRQALDRAPTREAFRGGGPTGLSLSPRQARGEGRGEGRLPPRPPRLPLALVLAAALAACGVKGPPRPPGAAEPPPRAAPCEQGKDCRP